MTSIQTLLKHSCACEHRFNSDVLQFFSKLIRHKPISSRLNQEDFLRANPSPNGRIISFIIPLQCMRLDVAHQFIMRAMS